MPWCSGKVTVPFGCSTALVMNRRPGHAPQPPPPVDALAGMAAALAGMAMAMSAVRPSALLTNLILRNLVIFTGCPFLWRGHQAGRRPKAPAVSLTPLGVRRGADLTSSWHTHPRTQRVAPAPWLTERARRAAEPRRCCRPGAKRQAGRDTREVIRGGPHPQVWSTANSAGGGYYGSTKPGRTRREPIRIHRTPAQLQAWS